MAEVLGPLFFECTWDDLTFYKMEGRYFVRKKSRLTREKVLHHPAFAKTRFYANRLAVASKIAAAIYSDLPLHWRQFWMYRDFTGEAINRLNQEATPQEAYDYLWKTYVEYWVLYQQATGIPLQTGRKQQPVKRPKDYKTRIRHRNSNPKCCRYRRLIGRNHWKSSYDNTAELLEKERKRLAREKKRQWLEDQHRKGRYKAREERWRKMQAKLLELPPEIRLILQSA
ncbi:hypothetical protein D3H65_15120 [Paraflavitalea soli]|uniref:Uncharacterized protein n=1 Tax=Paraflavitalea soli TaxID=2315862 RepID=A0A3B7ML82_9BACT|nr:hypothetical protein [Paraflavitalea soli]AXY75232.1 hypothetical protein D3H65_15120 [Paraflavitalea soli]